MVSHCLHCLSYKNMCLSWHAVYMYNSSKAQANRVMRHRASHNNKIETGWERVTRSQISSTRGKTLDFDSQQDEDNHSRHFLVTCRFQNQDISQAGRGTQHTAARRARRGDLRHSGMGRRTTGPMAIFDPIFGSKDRRWGGSSFFGAEDRRWGKVLRRWGNIHT